MSDLKRCFVVAPIGSSDSGTRKRSDKILKHVIKPVVLECGYSEPIRADQIGSPGLITTQIIEHIVEDELVIADLTDSNPNVFYELAIRHAIRKSFIQMIEKGQKIPFDVAASRTIEIDHTDLDSVEAAKTELRRQILAAEKEPDKVDNPISVTLDLKALNRSENPEERSLAALTSNIATIGTALRDINSRLVLLDKLQELDPFLKRIDEARKMLEKVHTTIDRKLEFNIYDIDDVMSKLESVESEIEDIKLEIETLRDE